jgi:EAL domain-containing protein (putative c-di-GMP-specific phosphodiesterase class I)
VIKVIIEMAHALGIKVVAEGVESAEQLAVLAEYHCDEVQGYHIARPAPFSSLVAALR